MTAVERRSTVRSGYDALAPRFADWMAGFEGEPSKRFVCDLASRLKDGARVLDLGCGDGANARYLSDRFDVVGVDVSEEQLRLARAAAPAATFVQADFMELAFPDSSFDAVTALYSLMHVPRDEHAALVSRIRRWLRPGGLFLASLSHRGGPDRIEDWLGVEMFFSGFDADTSGQLVREAGFELLHEELVAMQAPAGEIAFLWVLGGVR